MQRLRAYLFIVFLLTAHTKLCAQPTSEYSPGNINAIDEKNSSDQHAAAFVIRNIVITGNKKTKTSIILREIPFRTGDKFQLQQLVLKFEGARRQLMNTALFHEVTVALKSFEGYNVDILVDVKERWYVFPLPYFKMADRNLNQWLVQNKASLDRVNYGVKLMYNNITGYNDKLNLWLMSGYTKQASMSYDRLYFDKRMKWGMKAGLAVGKNREVNYNTINNKEVFLKDTNNFIRSFFKSNLELSYRRATKTRHRFGIGYTEERVHDTITELNPCYFPSGHSSIRFPEIYYYMTYYDVDYIPYPLKGFEAMVNIDKKGFNHIINVWELNLKTGNYWEIFPETYFSVQTMGSLKLPFKQSFFNTRLLGYGEMFMQGYEYYVVDGVAGGFLKTTFSRQLFNFTIPVPRTKQKAASQIPFRIYGKIYGNTGYVYNPQPGSNGLANRMLYSGGFGIDILTLYDVNIRLEWSFNQLGQNGIYLHKKTYF